jgi:hypothetical protein
MGNHLQTQNFFQAIYLNIEYVVFRMRLAAAWNAQERAGVFEGTAGWLM